LDDSKDFFGNFLGNYVENNFICSITYTGLWGGKMWYYSFKKTIVSLTKDCSSMG